MKESRKREIICSRVAESLRVTRQAKGLSMTDLAAKAGLSRSIISLIERGLRNPTLDTLLRITDVLEIPLGDVVKRAENAARKSG